MAFRRFGSGSKFNRAAREDAFDRAVRQIAVAGVQAFVRTPEQQQAVDAFVEGPHGEQITTGTPFGVELGVCATCGAVCAHGDTSECPMAIGEREEREE